MKQLHLRLLALLSCVVCVLPWAARADDTSCTSVVNHVDSVTTGNHTTTQQFASTNGTLDPMPLLEMQFRATKKGCLIAHLSVLAYPSDNAELFQVSVDGVPMNGHALFRFESPEPPTPVVYLVRQSTDVNGVHMASFTFSSPLAYGAHDIKVLFAGCCSSDPTGFADVESATLTLEYP